MVKVETDGPPNEEGKDGKEDAKPIVDEDDDEGETPSHYDGCHELAMTLFWDWVNFSSTYTVTLSFFDHSIISLTLHIAQNNRGDQNARNGSPRI